MKEFNFIDILKEVSLLSPYGIGDDCAVLGDFLIASDLACEGVHFLKDDPLEYIIGNLFTANISDIAAMGGKSGDYKALLSLSIPEYIDKNALAKEILNQCRKHNVTLIGGDTSSSRSAFFISMTIIGEKNKHILNRGGACHGDVVYLSREVGATRYYLEKRLNGDKFCYYSSHAEKSLGELLGSIDGVTSAIDISDGAGRDLSHIASMSGVKIVVDNLPLAELPIKNSFSYAVSSGEEYALIFTVSERCAGAVEKIVFERLGRKLFRIGKVYEGNGCFFKDEGKFIDISHLGYEHD